MAALRMELVDICLRRDDGKFLAVTNRKFGGFTAPGGKIDKGEEPYEAAMRELEEETGIKVTMADLLSVGVFEHRWRGIQTRCHGYVVTQSALGNQEPQCVEEGTEPIWVDRDDLLDPESACLAHAYYGWLMAKMDW